MSEPQKTPTVLVVLVVRDGARWLRGCLQGLATQTHRPIGVVAVDNASTDGSDEILAKALGAGRVLRLDERAGVAASVRAALDTPAAAEADFLLVLHDDAILAPDAVARMIEAAELEPNVGIVGPKVVDWDDARILREVGRSTDRFGHPASPLQDGEMDHGQYDRLLEVMWVSSCAMLVTRETWQRTGPPDERLDHREDLDLCWRARLAGFRVVMTPLAQARHRSASERGERAEEHRLRGPRYYAERAAVAAMLKNYGLRSLAWLLPAYSLLGIVRISLLAAGRRFEDALELLAAWVWNLLHLPGTLARRVRAQSVRAVADRYVRRFMESAGTRMPRWLETAGRILDEQRGIDEDEELHLGRHARSLARAHPVLVAWAAALFVGILAHRRLLGPEIVQGGVFPAFPDAPSDFFRELLSESRSTGLGGGPAASPALAVLGGLSALLVGSTALAAKVAMIALPAVAGVAAYRAALRQTGSKIAAVLSAASLSLSALMLWSFSEGRIGLLVVLATLPVIADRLESAFGAERPERPLRLVVGTGAALAIGAAFGPGVILAAGVLLAVHILASRARLRGIALSIGGALAAAVLAFPLLPGLAEAPDAALSSPIGTTRFADVSRLALGPAPGSWFGAWFLPAAALLGFMVVTKEQRGVAGRSLLAAIAGIFLAWASAAGYLPAPVSNPPVYVGVAAVAEATLVGLGVASLLSGLGRETFGLRQVAAGGLSVALAGGLALQALAAMPGGWAIGPRGVPDAWPVVATEAAGDYRVLWLGAIGGEPFPAPGGDPQGALEAGRASVRYALTDGEGTSALDVGRWSVAAGYSYLERALTELLRGDSVHAGALLSPLAVRFVVAEPGDLPMPAAARLDAQVDLDLVPAEGLVIYRNARAIPVASVVSGKSYSPEARRGELSALSQATPSKASVLRATDDGWSGIATADGMAVLSREFDERITRTSGSGDESSTEVFGWANAFPVEAEGPVTLRRPTATRASELAVLGLLWMAALWLTRRPASR